MAAGQEWPVHPRARAEVVTLLAVVLLPAALLLVVVLLSASVLVLVLLLGLTSTWKSLSEPPLLPALLLLNHRKLERH